MESNRPATSPARTTCSSPARSTGSLHSASDRQATRASDPTQQLGWHDDLVRAAGLLFTLLVYLAFSGCRASDQVDAGERRAIADSLQALVVRAYDFSKPDVSSRLLSLYADSGRVISAAAGRVHTTRAALASEIAFFWQRVGQNMREPRFDFGSSYVDIVTRDAAVMTFTYRIPHHTPSGTLHVVGGAWTTFWRREGGRWQIVQEHLSDTPESSAPGPSRMDSMPGMVMPPLDTNR